MPKPVVLYLVTELHTPVGGLYRYTAKLLKAWNRALREGKAVPLPLVLGLKKKADPRLDLRESKLFSGFVEQNQGVKVYEAKRNDTPCYFIEGQVPDLNSFHYMLWEKYGIRSEHISVAWPDYEELCAFWFWVPRIASWLEGEGREIACVDAQDWLAFPAGFLTREEIGKPLVCRFHSGEFGRALGNPNFEMAPILIEIAALIEADYIQGVSIEETMFEITNLLPYVEKRVEELRAKMGEMWYAYQCMKILHYKEFLVYEPEEELVLLRDMIGAMPNGIELNVWKALTLAKIERAKRFMKSLLPGKRKFVTFLGRPEYRKGLEFLVDAWKEVVARVPDAGLMIVSLMTKEEYEKWLNELKQAKLANHVYILNKWLSDEEKASLFCASDAIALPSVYEPFGIVALEALAADYACERLGLVGPVVIVGNTGGMGEIIRSGVNGLEVPISEFKMDTDLLAKMLVDALTNEALRRRLATHGAKRVQSKYFNWDFIFSCVLETWKKSVDNYKVYKRFKI